MIAVSGGLYLFDQKGETVATKVAVPEGLTIDLTSSTLESEVRALFLDAGIEHDFEYIRSSGTTLVTRPTSRTYYEIKVASSALSVTRHEPDLIKSIVELHKGHGPTLYKRFQQFAAAGLIFVLLSGLWLGVSAKGLRKQTLAAVGVGLVVFATLALN
tara:strand:+ start:1236 stop:1709 length:474 start_codon:yes stop_codon:yes gene_type:complete